MKLFSLTYKAYSSIDIYGDQSEPHIYTSYIYGKSMKSAVKDFYKACYEDQLKTVDDKAIYDFLKKTYLSIEDFPTATAYLHSGLHSSLTMKEVKIVNN